MRFLEKADINSELTRIANSSRSWGAWNVEAKEDLAIRSVTIQSHNKHFVWQGVQNVIPRGKANSLVNRNEERISREVYDLYRFLKTHPSFSTAPHRFKEVLRASVSGTPFGFIFQGLVSVVAATYIDEHIASGKKDDPCTALHRDHFYTWKDNAEFFLAQPILELAEFWSEMKRRNEVVFVTREEHGRLAALQRAHGHNAYAAGNIRLVRVDHRAMKLAGYKAAFVRAHWLAQTGRPECSLPGVSL